MTAIADHLRLTRWALAAAVVVLMSSPAAGQSGGYFVPGDAKNGMHLFFAKGCGRCHSVLGEGGRTAPDLARAPAGHLGASELLADMWNHAPEMWEKMRLEKLTPVRFSASEMEDLFAFLYSVRALDRPGNAERGRRLLADKGCLRCHAVAGQGSRVGPDLERWARYRNPVSWIQTMWNHGPAMHQLMAREGLPWPQFRDDDVADLIAYIRKAAPNPRHKVYLRPADPASGQSVFQQKGCSSCHALRGRGGRRGPDLARNPLPRTLGQFAADMWNHGPTMWSGMGANEVRRRQFSDKEMADLIAYLFAERYFEASGDARRGERLFTAKQCSSCHGTEQGVAPDLARQANSAPSSFAAALWNHGPVMFETMERQQVPWPVFRPGEMADLLEWLRTADRPPARGGKP